VVIRRTAPTARGKQEREVVEHLKHRASNTERIRPRTSATPCTPPTDSPPQFQDISYSTYVLYYHGSGYLENPDNPGAWPGVSPATLAIAYEDVASAVQDCTTFAYWTAGFFYSFDLSFLLSTCSWSCTAYYHPTTNDDPGSYFNVADSDVAIGLGYSSGG